jgi:opacity protein-like surface antigen
MSRKTVRNTVLAITGLLVTWPSAAQNPNKLTYHMGAGFTEPARHSDSRLDPGFNITGGAGYNFAPWIGILGEFSYNQLGVSSAALAAFGAPQGSARMYSLTANPIVRLNPRGRYDAYVVGGGGFYRRTVEFTEPTYAMVTAFDPFFGILYPAAIPANAILGSFTQNKGGLNIGAGVSIRVREDSKAKFFAEMRYHYMFTTPQATTVLPVTFGFRW